MNNFNINNINEMRSHAILFIQQIVDKYDKEIQEVLHSKII